MFGQSILSKETTRWQGLGVKPPTFRSEVQRTSHYTSAPFGGGGGGVTLILGIKWILLDTLLTVCLFTEYLDLLWTVFST